MLNISNFTTSELPTDTTVKVLTFNINRTHILEPTPNLNWNTREPKIIKMINTIDPDILLLQELRVLDRCKTNNEFLSFFHKFEFFSAGKNPTRLAFQQATGWDSGKFFASETLTRWLTSTPTVPSDTNPRGWGNIALFVKLYRHINGKICEHIKPFWVVNIHFPLSEEDKNNCCFYLSILTHEICGDDDYVLAGDFNSFYDLQGSAQISYLLDNLPSYPIDLTDIIQTSQNGIVSYGTFIGTSFDNNQRTFPNLSHLDHIFLPQKLAASTAVIHTETFNDVEPEELSERDSLPSDHLPVSIIFELSIQ